MTTRRDFLTVAALVLAAPAAAQTLPAVSRATVHPVGPYWIPPGVPAIVFEQGKAKRISVAGYVTDAQSIALRSGSLPQGVSFDPKTFEFVYDGVGAAGSTSGVSLIADDGRP